MAATIYGWESPLLASIYPGLVCGSNEGRLPKSNIDPVHHGRVPSSLGTGPGLKTPRCGVKQAAWTPAWLARAAPPGSPAKCLEPTDMRIHEYYIYIYLYICINICIYIHIRTCQYIYIYTHVCRCIKHISIHMFVLCTLVYIYIVFVYVFV